MPPAPVGRCQHRAKSHGHAAEMRGWAGPQHSHLEFKCMWTEVKGTLLHNPAMNIHNTQRLKINSNITGEHCKATNPNVCRESFLGSVLRCTWAHVSSVLFSQLSCLHAISSALENITKENKTEDPVATLRR